MQKDRKILYAAQMFKFSEYAKRQRAKKEQRRKKDNKNIRNGIGKTMSP